MNTAQLVENIINELDIGTRGLAKLIDVNPTTIHRWINEEVEISDEKLQHLEEVNRTIIALAKKLKCAPNEIVKPLISLKESPLWKGWEHAAQMLGDIELTIGNENYIKKHYIQNIDLIEDGLRKFTKVPKKLEIDLLCKDSKSNHLAVKFFEKSVALDQYGKIKNIQNKLLAKYGRKCRLILIAPHFLGTFAIAAANNKNLQLQKYELKTSLAESPL